MTLDEALDTIRDKTESLGVEWKIRRGCFRCKLKNSKGIKLYCPVTFLAKVLGGNDFPVDKAFLLYPGLNMTYGDLSSIAYAADDKTHVLRKRLRKACLR